MARSNKKVHLGDPEHVVTRDDAVNFISAQLRFVPKSDRQGLDRGVLDTASELLNLSGTPKQNADAIAETFVERLEGNSLKFNKFTVEALAFVNKDLFAEVLTSTEGHKADLIDQAIESLPLSNGKTFNAYDTARVAKMMDIDFNKFATHASVTRFPKSWMTFEGESRTVINPRGGKDIAKEIHDGFLEYSNAPEPIESIESYKSAFDALTAEQKDFIVDVYNASDESLSEAIAKADVLFEAKTNEMTFADSVNSVQNEMAI